MKMRTNHFERWVEYAKAKGMPRLMYYSVEDRFLRMLGFELPPSIFWGPWGRAVFPGVFYGVFWGTWMFCWLTLTGREFSLERLIVVSAIGGVFFGVGAVVSIDPILRKFVRPKYPLPSWHEWLKETAP